MLHLSGDHTRYLDVERLRGIVRRYADFIGVPIFLGGETAPANAVTAPWQRSYMTPAEGRRAHHQYWEGRFKGEMSLDVLPLDEPIVLPDPKRPGQSVTARLRGVLGITDRHVPDVNTRGTVEVYIARMFITSGSRDALPTWARFIQGIIECDVLTPNAARDDVVRNEALEVVREALSGTILTWLTRLSAEEPKRFVEIMRWHSYHVLGMAVQDEHEGFFRAVADLIPLESDKGPLTVKQYLDASPPWVSGKPVVHYIAERGSVTQYYALCGARGIRVFDASENFAERFLQRHQAIWPERLHLSRIDVSGTELIFEPIWDGDPDRDRYRDLEAAYAMIFPDIRCIAKVSRFKPIEMPAVLTESRDQKNRRKMEQVAGNVVLPSFLRDLVQGFLKENREPLSLHLNADNPTVQRLARRGTLRDAVATNALISLYKNAFMLLARAITPDNIRVMFQQYNAVIDLMVGLADERVTLSAETLALRARVAEMEKERTGTGGLTRWVTCFVAMPFDAKGDALLAALREVLEDRPYLWQVTRADSAAHGDTLGDNVRAHMGQAHCFVAEVSEPNPNVFLEVGRMQVLARPMLLVKREGAPELPADLGGQLFATYAGEGAVLVERLREEIRKKGSFAKQKGEGFLSDTVLRKSGSGLNDAAIGKLARMFETCEDFLAAPASNAATALGLRPATIQGVQEQLGDYLKAMG